MDAGGALGPDSRRALRGLASQRRLPVRSRHRAQRVRVAHRARVVAEGVALVPTRRRMAGTLECRARRAFPDGCGVVPRLGYSDADRRQRSEPQTRDLGCDRSKRRVPAGVRPRTHVAVPGRRARHDLEPDQLVRVPQPEHRAEHRARPHARRRDCVQHRRPRHRYACNRRQPRVRKHAYPAQRKSSGVRRQPLAARSGLARQPAGGLAAFAVVAREPRLPLFRRYVWPPGERRHQRRYVRGHLTRSFVGWTRRLHDGERHRVRARHRQHHERSLVPVASLSVTHGDRGSALVVGRWAMKRAAIACVIAFAAAANAAAMERSAFGTSAPVDGAGRIWVAYAQPAGQAGQVVLQRSDDNGATWQSPVRVNAVVEPVAAEGENRPKLAFGSAGEMYVTWTSPTSARFTGDIRFARSLDGGKTWSTPTVVHRDRQLITHRFESLLVDARGRLWVTWVDKRDLKAAQEAGRAYRGAAIY